MRSLSIFWLNKCQDNKLSTNLTDASNLRFARLVLARITLILKSQNKKSLAAKYFKLWNYETLKRARIVHSIGLSILSIYNLFKQVYIYMYIYIYIYIYTVHIYLACIKLVRCWRTDLYELLKHSPKRLQDNSLTV